MPGCGVDVQVSHVPGRGLDLSLSMQVVPGPLQSGAYPSIHHGTSGNAFTQSLDSSSTGRYSHSLASRTLLAQFDMHKTPSYVKYTWLPWHCLNSLNGCFLHCCAGLRMQRSKVQIPGLLRLFNLSELQPLQVYPHSPSSLADLNYNRSPSCKLPEAVLRCPWISMGLLVCWRELQAPLTSSDRP